MNKYNSQLYKYRTKISTPTIKRPGIVKNLNPLIYEKTSNGEEIFDIYSRLLKERILFIGEEFTPELANDVVGQLLFLDTQNEDPIHIYINSYGGDLSSMFAIYDVMC
jgi:ATP-dependent Clp protease protease subunit